jgi:glycosyltransferase involved in cell wall biosynthesis
MAAVLVRERRRFSILHLHGFSQKSIVLVLFGLLTRKRVAVKLTSVGHDDPASMRDRGGMAFWCYSRAHVFFGVSPRFRSIYESSGLPRDRFRLIPNGVDLARFSPASPADRRALRARLGIAADAPMLLFVGFFSREKCPDILFEAWTRMAAAGDRTSVLVFVGGNRSGYYEVDPSLADEIRVRAGQLNLEGRLRFVDSTLEIETYYRAADIFVMPSVREGLPNALLEAMACGLACVATRLDGVTDTILDDGASGILVPPRDVPALTTALVALVHDPARTRDMGARAREHVARTYSAATTAQQYLAAYRDMQAS